MPSGTVSDEHIVKLESFIATSLKIVARIGEQYHPKGSCNRRSFGGASTEAKVNRWFE
jgi:hypothetical protein